MRYVENIAESGRPQTKLRCMCNECWIPKAKNTYSDYAIVIDFQLQQWLQERASVLRLVPIIIRIF